MQMGVTMRTHRPNRTSLAAVVAAFLIATTASAGTVEELEARVAELEAIIDRLVDEQQAPPSVAENHVQRGTPTAESSYEFGGYVKLDAIWSDYGNGDLAPTSAGTQFYIPATIPVGATSGEGPDLDLQARETRIHFSSDTVTAGGKRLSSYIELDFFLGAFGDERISNSYNPRVRHAFFKYNDWLFGQTWSTFQDVAALPENLDFIGPAESTVFVRQAQVRYTKGPWEFAVENPETTLTPFGGGTRIVTNDGGVPDLVARYTAAYDDGYIKIAGLLRQLDYDIGGARDSQAAYGVSVSGKHAIGINDIRWMATIGNGTGRYLGLNTANDGVLDANGNIETIDQWGAFVSYRHPWNDQWRSNLTLGYLDNDHDVTLSGGDVTDTVYSIHANLLYSPIRQITMGGELIYAKRELENGLDGDMTRLLLSVKYVF